MRFQLAISSTDRQSLQKLSADYDNIRSLSFYSTPTHQRHSRPTLSDKTNKDKCKTFVLNRLEDIFLGRMDQVYDPTVLKKLQKQLKSLVIEQQKTITSLLSRLFKKAPFSSGKNPIPKIIHKQLRRAKWTNTEMEIGPLNNRVSIPVEEVICQIRMKYSHFFKSSLLKNTELKDVRCFLTVVLILSYESYQEILQAECRRDVNVVELLREQYVYFNAKDQRDTMVLIEQIKQIAVRSLFVLPYFKKTLKEYGGNEAKALLYLDKVQSCFVRNEGECFLNFCTEYPFFSQETESLIIQYIGNRSLGT